MYSPATSVTEICALNVITKILHITLGSIPPNWPFAHLCEFVHRLLHFVWTHSTRSLTIRKSTEKFSHYFSWVRFGDCAIDTYRWERMANLGISSPICSTSCPAARLVGKLVLATFLHDNFIATLCDLDWLLKGFPMHPWRVRVLIQMNRIDFETIKLIRKDLILWSRTLDPCRST